MGAMSFAVILCSKRTYTAGYRCKKESNLQGNQELSRYVRAGVSNSE
jgi:hypothetical protein